MPNPWFRLWADMIDDEKIRLIAFEDRWHFVALMCLKSSGFFDKEFSQDLLERSLCVKLGLAKTELENLRERLQEVELIDDNWQPKAWDKRQFQSDSSTGRVRKHRAKNKRNGEVTPCNVSVTPPDTETDTEIYTPFEDFWAIYPKRVEKKAAERAWKKLKPDEALFRKIKSNVSARLLSGEWNTSRDQKQYILNAATYLNGKRWEDELIRGNPTTETQWS